MKKETNLGYGNIEKLVINTLHKISSNGSNNTTDFEVVVTTGCVSSYNNYK